MNTTGDETQLGARRTCTLLQVEKIVSGPAQFDRPIKAAYLARQSQTGLWIMIKAFFSQLVSDPFLATNNRILIKIVNLFHKI